MTQGRQEPPGGRAWRRHVRRRAVAATAAVAVLAALTPAAAQERDSGQIERELDEVERRAGSLQSELGEVREEIAATEAELAAIRVALEDARGRLEAAEGQVELAEAALVEAEEKRAEADEEYQQAKTDLATLEAELEEEEALLIHQLVETFKYGSSGAQRGAMAIEVLRRAEDPTAFAVGMQQLYTVVDAQDAIVQQVFSLREQQAHLTQEAATARVRALEAEDEAETTLATVEELREEAAALATEVEEQEAAEAATLAALEEEAAETSTMLARVDAKVEELTQDLADQRAREERERQRAREERAASSSGPYADRPGGSGGPSIDGIVCPVQGAVAGRDFSNDWGYPRAGGRYHQGNDIFAPRGTPVVAVGAGEVIRLNPPSAPTALGGVTVTYRTRDGSQWYNAHLDSIASGIQVGASVSRGQQIGTVGDSGNARGTSPHLHIGRRYNGGFVNPWPTISPAC